MTTLAGHRAATMTEAELSASVREIAERYGMACYHTHDSRRSDPGWPDLVIAGHGRVLFRELKTATGRVTQAQRKWLERLTAAGLDVGVWRPADLIDGTIGAQITTGRLA